MKPMSHHQPLLPVSCRRRINTPRFGSKSNAPTTYEITGNHEAEDSWRLCIPDGMPNMIATTNVKTIHHQYSLREARPLKEQYFEKHVLTD